MIVMVARKGEGQGFDVNMLLLPPNYSTFVSLVKAANFTHKDFPSSFTIFAANNDALKASPHTLSLVLDIFTYLFIERYSVLALQTKKPIIQNLDPNDAIVMLI